MNGTGIYRIDIAHHFYIGSAASSFCNRRSGHLNKLRKNEHGNRHMQNAWNKYGEESFRFSIVEECIPEDCIAVEQRYIDQFFGSADCMNLSPTAQNTLGVKYSEESRRKLSECHSKRVVKESTRQIHSERMKSFRHSEEGKAKIAASNRARNLSDETKKKMGEKNKGRIMSPESRKKMSLARSGCKKSPETRARMVEAQKRRNEQRKQMSVCSGQLNLLNEVKR
jgi:group I intron endonuclease